VSPKKRHISRSTLHGVVLAACLVAWSPTFLALVARHWTPVGGAQLQLGIRVLSMLTAPLAQTPFLGPLPWLILTTGVVAAGVLLVSLLERSRPTSARLARSALVAGLALWALPIAPWVLVLAACLDPLLLVGALLVSGCFCVRSDPTAKATVRGDRTGAARALGLLAALSTGIILFAAAALDLGSDPQSPLFVLRRLWVTGPGCSAWTSGGSWLALGIGAIGCRYLGRRPPFPPRRRWVLAGGIAAALLVLEVLAAEAAHLAVARAVSATGVVLLGVALLPAIEGALRPSTRSVSPAAPHYWLATLAPSLLLAAVCVVRTLTVDMWTQPPSIPEEVERLSERRHVFSLAVVPRSGEIVYSVREENRVGILASDGDELGSWSPRDGLTRRTAPRTGNPENWAVPDKVEVVRGPEAGLTWVSVDKDELGLGLMPVAGNERPSRFVSLDQCSATAWLPLPRGAIGPLGTREGDVLVGCEQRAPVPIFRPAEERVVAHFDIGTGLESGAFTPDGDRIFGVMLVGHPNLRVYRWPSGHMEKERLLGPLNWCLALDPERHTVWLGRFLEGALLLLDSRTLETKGQVPLSFGIRDVIYEPRNDTIWAAAAYSGLVWSVEAQPPYRKQAYALCGEARSLAADSSGRVVVGTDCGVYRIDPARRRIQEP
jgi:hypothetical protein